MPYQNIQAATTGLKAGLSENRVLSRISPRGSRARWLGVALSMWLIWFSFISAAADAPAFRFQTNDVIAFVGGEDVVEMQRNGYLELMLTTALPHHKLRFRNLAFEGDTVFEQHRQLNFPSWEKQLERVGATVVIAQFGQTESLQGTKGLPKFVAAYDGLLDRFTNGGRRIVLLAPTPFEKNPAAISNLESRGADWGHYLLAIIEISSRRGDRFVGHRPIVSKREMKPLETRDGLHLNRDGHGRLARTVTAQLGIQSSQVRTVEQHQVRTVEEERLRQLIIEKNRLWFDYWRPQNWAFLNGDRIEQPSSRDHRDLKKRWFPEEMEKFLPLIEAKEKEIWEAARKLR